MTKIELENVSYVYSKGTPYEVKALDGLSVGIEAGSITGIIGHTGSGKSTFVQLLNGLERPSEGRVLLDGKDIWEDPKAIGKIRFRVGLVMQYPEYQLFEETIRADIAFGPKNMGLDEKEIEERVLMAADFVGLERELLDKSPFDLSGGQKRRAAIAGIIAMKPEVLVLDEPAAGLDPLGRDAIFGSLVKYRNETGATVIIVSHSMEDMARFCEDVIVLSHAKLAMKGKCSEIFSRADFLTEIGLDVPEITLCMKLLASRGVPVSEGIYTVEDAVKELARLLS
ncbi:MAG: energy-coupling factor transporter ATPase [Ruminococcaceae bacterium]|nr:energy-coupling factor transporter ATPase [Oscillospiraceae bacterium]